jgi:hypothetical protein
VKKTDAEKSRVILPFLNSWTGRIRKIFLERCDLALLTSLMGDRDKGIKMQYFTVRKKYFVQCCIFVTVCGGL